jgi:nitrate reductase gamma subunit
LARPEFWGLYAWLPTLFYIAAALSLSVFSLGFYVKLSTWTTGAAGDEDFIQKPAVPGLAWLSVKTLFTSGCLLAGRLFRLSPVRAVFLLAIKWSFLLLFLGTLISFLNFHIVHGFLSGWAYNLFKLVLDWAGVFFVLGIFYALGRRLHAKGLLPSTGYDYSLLLLMLFIGLTAFVMQGARFNMGVWEDAAYSPAGMLFKEAFKGMRPESCAVLYNAAWAVHASLALLFIAYIPYSRIFHVFAAQITTYAAEARDRESGIR